MRSPITWFGGKGQMANKILPLFPPHKRYCEPFGGGASLLFAKRPAEVETYNDLDSGLVGFYRVLRDPDKFSEFKRRVDLIPLSREEYNRFVETWEQQDDEVERVVRWYFLARNSFSGNFGMGMAIIRTETCSGMAETTASWLSIRELLPLIHRRIMPVQIENQDFERIINNTDTPETLFYCDPPYPLGTRKAKRYKWDMDDADHERFLSCITKIEGMAIISSYPNEMYDKCLASWRKLEFETACHAAGRTRATGIIGAGAALEKAARTEVLWLSPATIAATRQTELDLGK